MQGRARRAAASPPAAPRAAGCVAQRVDHHVADERDALGRNALAREVRRGRPLGGVEQVGDLVGEDAVDLLRHRAVEAAQARLHVHDRDVLLHRHQAAGERGVHVADDEHRGGPVLVEHRFEAAHDLGGLHRVRAGAHLEVQVGRGQPQVGEEPVAHRRVVVLAGVHEHGARHARVARERGEQRRHLHEVGPCADDAEDGPGHRGVCAHQGIGRRTATAVLPAHPRPRLRSGTPPRGGGERTASPPGQEGWRAQRDGVVGLAHAPHPFRDDLFWFSRSISVCMRLTVECSRRSRRVIRSSSLREVRLRRPHLADRHRQIRGGRRASTAAIGFMTVSGPSSFWISFATLRTSAAPSWCFSPR